MKYIYSFLICVLFLFRTTCNAQIFPSDCTTTDSVVRSYYYGDAVALAYDRLYLTLKSPDTINVTINPVYIDSILRPLLAVHNAVGLYNGDTVKNLHIYCPKTIGPYFALTVDTSKIWVQNWNNNIVLTGDTTMDNFLIKYKVHSVSADTLLTGFYYFTTDWYFNLKALLDSFMIIPGVQSAYNYSACFGQGAWFQYNYDGYYQYLTYHYGFGDCESGCGSWKDYYFKIYPDCSVEILNTDIIEPNKNTATFFPNPTTNQIEIKGNDILSLTLYDVLGRIVFSNSETVTPLTINTTSFSRGIYFLQARTKGGVVARKVVLQ